MQDKSNAYINFIFSLALGLMPLLVLTLHSGIHIASISLFVISGIILYRQRDIAKPLTNSERVFVGSLFLLPVVIAFDCFLRDSALRYLDYPLRFILVLPVFFAMRKMNSLSIVPLLYGLYIGSIAAGCIALYQSLVLDIPRVYGNLHITTFGHISIVLSLLSFNTLLLYKNIKKHLIILAIVAALMGVVAAFLSGTRASWLAILPCCIIWFKISRGSVKAKQAALLVFFIGLFALYNFNHAFQTRLTEATLEVNAYFDENKINTAIGLRGEMWKGALYIFRDNPLFGSSMGGYKQAMAEKNTQGFINMPTVFDHAHNAYLHYLATLGFVGFFAYIFLFIGALYFFVGELKTKTSPEKKFSAISGVIILSSYMTFDLAGFSFGHQHTAVFFAIMLIIMAGLTRSYDIEMSYRNQ